MLVWTAPRVAHPANKVSVLTIPSLLAQTAQMSTLGTQIGSVTRTAHKARSPLSLRTRHSSADLACSAAKLAMLILLRRQQKSSATCVKQATICVKECAWPTLSVKAQLT